MRAPSQEATLKMLECHRVASDNTNLREALRLAEYYINRLEAVHAGKAVRDLGEACTAWQTIQKHIAI